MFHKVKGKWLGTVAIQARKKENLETKTFSKVKSKKNNGSWRNETLSSSFQTKECTRILDTQSIKAGLETAKENKFPEKCCWYKYRSDKKSD